jgi:hypothetical protein
MDSEISIQLNQWKTRPTQRIKEIEIEKMKQKDRQITLNKKWNIIRHTKQICLYCKTEKGIYFDYKFNLIMNCRVISDYVFKCAFQFYLPIAYYGKGIQETEKTFIVCSNKKFPLHITHLIYSFINRHTFFYYRG